jgi:hypothetical protein
MQDLVLLTEEVEVCHSRKVDESEIENENSLGNGKVYGQRGSYSLVYISQEHPCKLQSQAEAEGFPRVHHRITFESSDKKSHSCGYRTQS